MPNAQAELQYIIAIKKKIDFTLPSYGNITL
jgi:hypothetical protein